MKTTIKTIVTAVCLAVALSFAATAMAKDLVQEKCPVMGYKPTEKLYVDYQGKRVYFCCASCPEEFKKNPDAYMKKLKEQGVELEDAPSE